jgi:50S ribosomal protein L16 3-hydroxylase
MASTATSSRLALQGLSPAAFLARYWQKNALLARNALPGFTGLASRDELFALAGRDDVESRLVLREGTHWSLTHGPFRKAALKRLPSRGWTLLVQGLNLHVANADALMRRFSFIPYARLDDLMVTYAVPGGGVGPHVDSYDVFLLQGFGRRRWRYGAQDDRSLRPGLPVKILRRFTPQHDAILAPGDMLYLPPEYAHDGVAIDECTTYSIGFRAASHGELAQAFLDHLRDHLDIPGRYADPDLKPAREPARVSASMQRRIGAALRAIRWDSDTVARFAGSFLSEPKPHVFFEPPAHPVAARAFAAALGKRGVELDRRTQWLYDDAALYINGEAHPWPAQQREALMQLANARALASSEARDLRPDVLKMLYDGYRNGFLHLA